MLMAIEKEIEELFDLGVRGMYFRRDGTPYQTAEEWAKDFEGPSDGKDLSSYRRVAKTSLWWGGWVSTVWLGLNHNYGGGKPLIFETMVFYRSMSDLDMDRYSTEAEAIQGHKKMCKRWQFPLIPLVERHVGIYIWKARYKLMKLREKFK